MGVVLIRAVCSSTKSLEDPARLALSYVVGVRAGLGAWRPEEELLTRKPLQRSAGQEAAFIREPAGDGTANAADGVLAEGQAGAAGVAILARSGCGRRIGTPGTASRGPKSGWL